MKTFAAETLARAQAAARQPASGMDKLVIEGGRPARRDRRASPAPRTQRCRSSARALLTPEPLRLTNVPQLNDVRTMRALLKQMGVAQDGAEGSLTLEASRIDWPLAPYELVRTMRASILALGPLVARCGEARVSLPGGCAIGLRPVDQHVKGLEAMGAEISLEHGYIEARAKRLRGARFAFDLVTVTGTENLMMAAALADGQTVLENAAREPEVVDLAHCLRAMGARIGGDGTDTITIEGVERVARRCAPRSCPTASRPARSLAAAAATHGDVTLEGASAASLAAVLDKLREAGATIDITGTANQGAIRVRGNGALSPFNVRPHPIRTFPPTCRRR